MHHTLKGWVSDMNRRIIVDESKIFDACAMVEEVVKHLTSTSCPHGTTAVFVLERASSAAKLLNQAMEEGELV